MPSQRTGRQGKVQQLKSQAVSLRRAAKFGNIISLPMLENKQALSGVKVFEFL